MADFEDDIKDECCKCGGPVWKDEDYEVFNSRVYCEECISASDARQDERDNSSCYTANF